MFREILKDFGIEFAGAVPFSACRIFAEDIITRRGVDAADIKSAVLFLVPYYVAGEEGNISVYARAHDYHLFFEKLYEEAVPRLSAAYGAPFYGFADKSAIAEVHAASLARLGKIGDNGLIINEKYGSFVFIGELLTTAAPSAFGIDEAAFSSEPAYCDHCGACKKACPMSEGLGCLSFVTQKKGELSAEERDFIHRHGSAWGCDICSAVCPYTKKAVAAGNSTPIEFFKTDRIAHLTTAQVEAMDKAAFRERAFAWRGKKTILRNLEIFGE